MSDSLRAALIDVSRAARVPADLADSALRLAVRRRRRVVVGAPVVAMVAVAVLVFLVASAFSFGRRVVVPAGPVSGPGSVPSSVGASANIRSEFSAPIARASLMYRDRSGSAILVSADGDVVRALRVSSSGGYHGDAYALSPDGRKVAYAWQKNSPLGGSQAKTQLRVVTLATGATASLALPGVGLGEPVESVAWSADGSRLLVQGVVTERVQPNGSEGAADCFLVDIGSRGALSRGAKVDVSHASIDGWSSDGERLLTVEGSDVRITNLAGAVVRTIALGANDAGSYQNQFGEGGLLWSPDEQRVAVAAAQPTPGRPLNYIDNLPRPYILRAISLTSSDSKGVAAETDVDVGEALDAQVIGWVDDEHPMVAVSAGGTERVYSVDVTTGAKRVVVTFEAGVTWAAPQVAGDIVRAGGFRQPPAPPRS
jgi:hypothetical protein